MFSKVIRPLSPDNKMRLAANNDEAAGEQASLSLQPHIRFDELRTAIDEFTAKAHDFDYGRRDKQHRHFKRHRFKPLAETFTVAVYRMNDQVAQLPLETEAVALLK